jgi:hypothetical protein
MEEMALQKFGESLSAGGEQCGVEEGSEVG